MLFTNFAAGEALPSLLLFVSISASKLIHLLVSNCWSADHHLGNHNNRLPLERATWDFCSSLSCRNGMQDILWFIFPFLIRYERNIKRNSEIFPFSQNEMECEELLLKKHAIFPWRSGFIKWENYLYCYFCLMSENKISCLFCIFALSNEITYLNECTSHKNDALLSNCNFSQRQ